MALVVDWCTLLMPSTRSLHSSVRHSANADSHRLSAIQVCDAQAFLACLPGGQLDLITAADVLPYIGDLEGLFSTAASALKKGGLFVFTTEEMMHDRQGKQSYPESGFCLNQFTRYVLDNP